MSAQEVIEPALRWPAADRADVDLCLDSEGVPGQSRLEDVSDFGTMGP